MKNITQHTIDEWLFDYFEGNLNEEDSERLLREVATNNEFMEEFNYWKQSYLKDYPSVQYASSEKLKKKPVGKIFWAGLGALVISALCLFYFSSEKKSDTPDTTIAKPTGQSGTAPEKPLTKKIIHEEISTERIKKDKPSITRSQQTIIVTEISIPMETPVSSINQDTTLLKENDIPVTTNSEVKNEVTNSSDNKKETIEKSSNRTKTKKNPLKNLRLKPGEEINKMNSDF